MKNTLSRILGLLVLLALGAASSTAQTDKPPKAEPQARQIPDALKAWEGWATWDDINRECPTPYNDASKRLCFWPSRLGLDIQRATGQFDLGVTTFSETWIPLPGNQESWPLGVTVNGAAVPVVEHENRPSLRLPPGTYQIVGSYRWNEYPQRIQIPREIGLLSLVLEGQPVEFPVWDSQGFLWLKRDGSSEEKDKDSLQLKVHALMEDGIPLWLRTEVELIVSGKSREEELGTVIPAGWKISAVESQIPVAVDDSGRMKAQVRSGRWTVQIDAFRSDNPTEFRYPEGAKPAAKEELIAFHADPSFRTVEILGPEAIDASQTTFPDKWRVFPLYRWDTSTPIRLEERMRGMGEQKPAGLSITRELWLDENGRELTFRDKISGNMQQIWRLDAAPGQDLGSVRSEGQGQLITRNPQNGRPGVEIRTRNINLEATGRMDRERGLPATGWNSDADNLKVTLNMPPGWRLFALFGADWVYGDWLTAWTLLDLFLLLIFSLAVFRLWGVAPAVLAFVAFGLSYHEPGAPRYTWLLILVPLALLRVVPRGWGHRIVTASKWVIIAVFAFTLIPFLADQIQQTLYPQLEDVRAYSATWRVRSARESAPAAAALASETVDKDATGRIKRKLENIVIPRIEFREASLREAVDFLQKQSVALDTGEQDPSRKGVRIDLKVDELNSGPGPGVIPGLELPGAGAAPVAPVPSEPSITVSLSKIPLGEALRYVTGLFNLKFKVEPDGVSIVPQGTPTESLITKEFQVQPGFLASIPSAPSAPTDATRGGSSIARRADAKDFLVGQGVTFPPGSTAIYLPEASKLIIRNTKEDIDLVDAIVNAAMVDGAPGTTLQYDPGARIQTGPAIPEWSWRSVSFGWNGPVLASQEVRPVLISSGVERLLSILRVGLIVTLVTILLDVRRLGSPLFRTAGKATVVLLITLLWGSAAASAQTPMPDAATLEKLRERLTKPSDAYPNAADIPSVTLKLNDRRITIDAEIHAAIRTAVPLPGQLPAWSPVSVFVDDKPEIALRREDGFLWVVLPQGVHRVRVEGRLTNVTEWEWTFLLRPHQVVIEAPGWTVTGVRPNGVPEQQVFFALNQKATAGEVSYDRQDFQTIASITRNLDLGLLWQASTTVTRLSPLGKAVALRIPLLAGENVLTSSAVVKDGFIEVRLGAMETSFTWESGLPISNRLALATRPEDTWVESWRLVASPVWNISFSGLTPIFESENPSLLPVWRPWPGEKAELAISRPEALAGATVTVKTGTHSITLGKRQRVSKLDLSLLCSVGEDFLIDLPAEAEITSLTLGGKPIPARKTGTKLIVPLRPGEQSISVSWRINTPLGVQARAEEVRLPVESANIQTIIEVPENRWVLWAHGPQRGPAVRFWGILICSLLAAVALGRLAASPLRAVEWMLLVIGLTQVPLPAALVVVGWLFLLAWRGSDSFQQLRALNYDLLQLLIIGITAVAIGILIIAVGEGLLGRPEMFISGNDSSRTLLRWYQPRSGTTLPTPIVLSVSIWWYRLLMLAWALWLATALIRWLQAGWQSFSRGGIFRPIRRKIVPAQPSAAQQS
ncbi:hypothetical protein ACXR0O_26975 [Verrucomicrobiota bacterium sgz303538]